MKKLFKIVSVVIVLIIAILVLVPFLFQDKLKAMVKDLANESVEAKVDFADVNLSFFKHFPNASLTIEDLLIENQEPFKGDTLAYVSSFSLDFKVTELLKDTADGPITVAAVYLNEGNLNFKKNKVGEANWDIAKPSKVEATTEEATSNSKGFVFELDEYEISNTNITYQDEKEALNLSINKLNHNGSGVFSSDVTDVDTHTDLEVSYGSNNSEILSNYPLRLDAIIIADLKNNIYKFKENKIVFNQLPLRFSGEVDLRESGQFFDLKIENVESTFKDLISAIPSAYTADLNNIDTSGEFNFNGTVNGLLSDKTVPKLNFSLVSNNASLKYSDLPKRIEDISINAKVVNTTGKTADTYLALNKLDFRIDDNVFKSAIKVSNFSNANVDAKLNGVLNLGHLNQAYPLDFRHELTGVLKADLETKFDVAAIKGNAYQRIKNNGSVSVSDFHFSSNDIVNPINISKADIDFKPGVVRLSKFEATSGKTDINANGQLNNVLGFLLSDKKLQGDFKVTSDNFYVSDFMVKGGSDTTTEPKDVEVKKDTEVESLKIPAFLDCSIKADAKTVHYDNITLKDVKGDLVIKNEAAKLKNVTSSVFGGQLGLNGEVDTKKETPVFNMALKANSFNVSNAMAQLDFFKKLVPIGNLIQGDLNSDINISGALNKDYTPDLSTIGGSALAELLSGKIKPNNEAVLGLLENKLQFLDFSKLDLKEVVAALKFKDGKVFLQPMDLQYEDIGIKLSGAHSFTNDLDYKAVLNVPAKYLGNEVTGLLSQIDEAAAKDIKVPITATILGGLKDPKVTTDLKSSVNSLTTQLIDIKKKQLINKGKGELKSIINDALGGGSKTDNGKKAEAVGNILGGILGGSKKKDSTSKKKKSTVKDVLGGFLGN